MQRVRTHLVQVLDILDLALEELLELELLLAEILPNALTDQSGLTDTFSFHFGSNRFSIQLRFHRISSLTTNLIKTGGTIRKRMQRRTRIFFVINHGMYEHIFFKLINLLI